MHACVLYDSGKAAILNLLATVMGPGSVFCDLATECINTVRMNFRLEPLQRPAY
jgi:hypothetical protein